MVYFLVIQRLACGAKKKNNKNINSHMGKLRRRNENLTKTIQFGNSKQFSNNVQYLESYQIVARKINQTK